MTDNNTTIDFADYNINISHIACICSSEIERQNNALTFIEDGIHKNEKCIAAISEYSSDLWHDVLYSHGINPQRLRKNQFEIISATSITCARTNASLLDELIDKLLADIESSLSENWDGIRVCSGFDSFLHNEQAVAKIFTSENSVNESLTNHSVKWLCTFGSTLLHPDLLDSLISFHPYITNGTTVNENASYVQLEDSRKNLPNILKRLKSSGVFNPPFASLDFDRGLPVIRTGDELDISTVPVMEELAERVRVFGHKNVIVDLSSTVFMDASSLSALIRMTIAAEKMSGRLAVYDPMDPQRKIFRLVGLNERVPIFSNLDQAISYVQPRCEPPVSDSTAPEYDADEPAQMTLFNF
ncbi:MAG: MEDS domain-containing protein [Armatimonadota bacterium]